MPKNTHHLPPRCPLQRRQSIPSHHAASSAADYGGGGGGGAGGGGTISPCTTPCTAHHLTPSQCAAISQHHHHHHPSSWVEDVLRDQPDPDHNGGPPLHRCSASDSDALLLLLDQPHTALTRINSLPDTKVNEWNHEWMQGGDALNSFQFHNEGGNNASPPSVHAQQHDVLSQQKTSGVVSGDFVSSYVYGPNSPRTRMFDTTFLQGAPSLPNEGGVGDILFSHFHFVEEGKKYPCSFQVHDQDDVNEHHNGAASSLDSDPTLNGAKRHSGQRSRVRKLQYIAELERTVNTFQALEAKLAAKVASLIEQQIVLNLENKNLRYEIAWLTQQKKIKDGEYLSLKGEIERLKMVFTTPARNMQLPSYFSRSPSVGASAGLNIDIMDLSKLSLT